MLAGDTRPSVGESGLCSGPMITILLLNEVKMGR